MTITRPTPLRVPFASSATASYINTLPDSPSGSYLASWPEGFPPITMTPVAGGGVSPSGADFNGALRDISAGVRWTGAGGLPTYNSALSAAIGGYPLGAVLALSSTTLGLVAATSDGATTDPNSSTTGWAPFGGIYSGGACAWATDSSTTANTVILTTRLPLAPGSATVFPGMTLRFARAGLTNTSTSVGISVNGVIYPNLAQLDGQSVPTGSLVYGGVYDLTYDGTKWRVAQPLAASSADAQAQTSVGEFLSPAGLALAMQGANQSLTASSWYQKVPGGLVLMGGSSGAISLSPGGSYAVTFPVTLANAVLFPSCTVLNASVNKELVPPMPESITTTGMSLHNYDSDSVITSLRWMVVGY